MTSLPTWIRLSKNFTESGKKSTTSTTVGTFLKFRLSTLKHFAHLRNSSIAVLNSRLGTALPETMTTCAHLPLISEILIFNAPIPNAGMVKHRTQLIAHVFLTPTGQGKWQKKQSEKFLSTTVMLIFCSMAHKTISDISLEQVVVKNQCWVALLISFLTIY